MKEEFTRYKIPQFRKLTGVIQLLGAFGIIMGFWIDYLQILSTIGLSLLMLFGVITRIIIKDSLMKTLPALLYCLLNGYLCFELIQNFME
jgi:intracellular septation protein A|tara:strand:- start:75 stop:344 length:270 start_codon:yes stop_codon:yes gene_type:complete